MSFHSDLLIFSNQISHVVSFHMYFSQYLAICLRLIENEVHQIFV